MTQESLPSIPLPPPASASGGRSTPLLPPAEDSNFKIHIVTQSSLSTRNYVQDIVDLVSSSFDKDPSMIHRWPKRAEYPKEYKGFITRIARSKLLDPASYMLVVEDTSNGEIIAHGDWERRGPIGSSQMTEERSSWLSRTERTLLEISDKIMTNRLLFPNPAADYEKIDMMSQQWTVTRSQYWETETRLEQWHLNMLCVHPDYRRKGVGAMLVDWGLQLARRDKLVAGLEASSMARSMYVKMGFEVLGVKDDFHDGSSIGYIMMWDGCGVEKEESERAAMVKG